MGDGEVDRDIEGCEGFDDRLTGFRKLRHYDKSAFMCELDQQNLGGATHGSLAISSLVGNRSL